MHVRLGRCVAVAGVLLALVAAFSPLSVQRFTGAAAESLDVPEFTIYSEGDSAVPWFDIAIEAGSTAELVAGVRLSAGTPVALRTYATNAVNPPNGGFAASEEGDEPTGATRWISFAAQSFELSPGDDISLPFSVAVPEGTPPGEYVTSLVVQTAEPFEIPGVTAFQQVLRSTVSVEITVPGDTVAAFEFGDPVVVQGVGQWMLDVPITNTGTARLRPRGDLTLVGMNGKIVSSVQLQMGSVYGGNSTVVRVPLPASVSPGAYVVSMSLADDTTGARAGLDGRAVTIEARGAAGDLSVDTSVTPVGEPLGYVDLEVAIGNGGPAIPRARVDLVATLDGETVESYPLSTDVALSPGETRLEERYVPPGGWRSGTWTFQVEVSAINDNYETVLAAGKVEGAISIP